MKKVLLITALVFGLGVAGLAVPFSGSWETDVTIKTPQTPTFELESVLKVDYTIGGWTFGSVSTFAPGWTQQDFSADGAIGAFEFTNLLRFDPAEREFNWLRSTTKVSIAGVDLEGRLLIVPDGSGFRARFSAPVEDLTFAATAYFGSLAFDPVWWSGGPYRAWGIQTPTTHTPIFRGLDVDITMPFYSTTLTIDVDFNPAVAGLFEDITFDVPAFPLGIPGFTLDLSVKYTLEKQTVTVTPAVAVADWVHFEPFISFDWAEPEETLVRGLRVEGLRLTWDVSEAVRFRYFWDARRGPHWPGRVFVVPRLVIGGTWTQFRQMVELRYKAAPITLTMAGRWDPGIDAEDMPMFPDRVDIGLALADVLPGFAVRTGVVFGYPSAATAFHAVSFGFTVTW